MLGQNDSKILSSIENMESTEEEVAASGQFVSGRFRGVYFLIVLSILF